MSAADEPLVYEPLLERDGLRVSRSPWGEDDEIGRLNWLSDESRAAAVAAADMRRTYDLSVRYEMGMPAWLEAQDPPFQTWMTHRPSGEVVGGSTGTMAEVHRRYSYSGSTFSMYSHTGTHLSSLTHFGHYGMCWNGWTEATHLTSRGWTVGGVVPPIIARAVLLDVAAALGVECLPASHAITPRELAEAARFAGVSPQRGDLILVRTGQMTHWPDQERFLRTPPGLGMEAAIHLCEEIGAMCVGVDAGGEVLPPERRETFMPVHCYMLATAGTPIIENLWLEDVAAERRYRLVVFAFPQKIRGSTGLPVRPVAAAVRSDS